MKAIIFAAGKGTRLKPFTDIHPKALAPVGDRCILDLVICKLIGSGVDGIVINVHHFAGQIMDFIEDQQYSVPIEFSDESDLLLETGGALAKIARESKILHDIPDDESIIVHNSDILTDFPLNGLRDIAKECDGAILVNPERQTSRKFLFDNEGWLRGWINEKTGAVKPSRINPESFCPAAFGGVHCLHRPLLDRISEYCGINLRPFGIVDFYMDTCCNSNTIKAYSPALPYRWYDIGTAEHLAQVQQISI